MKISIKHKLTLSLFVFLMFCLAGMSRYTHAQLDGASGGPAFIKNPLATDSIQEFLEAILTVVMILSVPVIIFFLIYAGFMYTTARGNSDQIKQATQAFTYAIIGGLIVLGALVLVGIIQNLVSAFGAGGSGGGSGGASPQQAPFTEQLRSGQTENF